MGLLRMFKHRRDAKGDRKRLTKQYESTTSSHYHYNHNHSNAGNFGKDDNDHSSSRHESNAYSFRTLDDTDDVNYYSDPEQQHYFSNGNSHNHNNISKSHKNKKRSNAKKQSTSNQGSNFNHSTHNNSSEFNDAWDTDFPYLSHASSSPHYNDNNYSNNINNNSNSSWSDQFHVMEASTMQQQQQYRPSNQGGGEGGHRPMYNDNFNSKNPRMRSQKDVMYPDSTDSELSDYEKAGKPHMIASAFDDDDDNGNEEREDDHIFMFGDFGKKSTSHATKTAVGRVGGGNRSSNNRDGFFGSISLPDHTAMIRSQYASQFKQRPMTTDTSLPGTIITSSTTPGGSPSVISSNRSCASSSRISSRSQRRRQASRSNRYDRDDSGEEDVENENFIKEQIEGTIGQMGFAADHESISGWSRKSGQSSVGGRSHRSLRSHRSRKSKSSRVGNNYGSSSNIYASTSGHNMNGVVGCDQLSSASGHSRRSRGSKSVSKELTRLEHLLANVAPGMSPLSDNVSQTSGKREAECDIVSRATGRASHRSHLAGALHDIQVPPGKLGVILANNERGTVVSRVRLNSELFGKIFESDRIMAIDGEDVSKFPYDVIISIMNRKADYERLLTVLRPQETIAMVNNMENNFNTGDNYFDGRQHMFPN